MTLVCISDGEEREHLEKLARELGVDTRTIFTGFIHEARQYLKAFDVVCLPSVKEGLPYVLLEALYAGVPIVASDLPGIREVVGSDVALVPPRDVQALVRALQTLPPAPSKPHFTFEEMLQKTHALYIRQAR
jgi:glycosyltransferase involved in cell wall biosynthesis